MTDKPKQVAIRPINGFADRRCRLVSDESRFADRI